MLEHGAPPSLPIARMFHTPMQTATVRRVPSRGVWGCEVFGLAPYYL